LYDMRNLLSIYFDFIISGEFSHFACSET